MGRIFWLAFVTASVKKRGGGGDKEGVAKNGLWHLFELKHKKTNAT